MDDKKVDSCLCIDLQAERRYWSYAKRDAPDPLQALPPARAWPLYVEVYSLRINHPRLSREEARTRFLGRPDLGLLVTKDQKARLFDMIWSRMASLTHALRQEHRSAPTDREPDHRETL